MNKAEFFEKLKEQLTGVPESTQNEILADYEEHFTVGIENGKTEEEIAKRLGDPSNIAKEVKTYSLIQKAETQKSASNLTQAVLATLGVSVFNILFIVGPYLGIAGMILGFVFCSLMLIFGGLIGAILVAASPYFTSIEVGIHPAAGFMICLALLFLGIFCLIVNYFLVKGFYRLTIAYLKLNINIIKKGM